MLLRYEERICELEESVSTLRLSRRLLMTLLEQTQQDQACLLDSLQQENSRLRHRVSVLARSLWKYQALANRKEESSHYGE